jgi:hypothetical protein
MKFDPKEIDRIEYDIFEKLLGRNIKHGKTPTEVHQHLHALAEEAFHKDPHNFVNLLAWKKIQNLNKFQQSGERQKKQDLDYIVSHLMVSENGHLKNPSSQPLTNWNPARGGIVTYVRKQIDWIISELLTEKTGGFNRAENSLSLEELNEKGIKLGEDGSFRKSSIPHPESIHSRIETNLIDHFNGKKFGGTFLDQDEETEFQESEIAPSKLAHLGKKITTKGVTLAGQNRNDMAFFRKELSLSAEDSILPTLKLLRKKTLRAHAAKVIKLNPAFDQTNSIGDKLQQWNPNERDFLEQFPEFSAYIKSRDENKKTKTTEAIVNRSSSTTDFEIISEAIDQTEYLAKKLSVEIKAYRGVFDLTDKNRPDHEFLMNRLGVQDTRTESSTDNLADLKNLGMRYIHAICVNATDLENELTKDLKDWNPEKQSFTRALSRSIIRIAEEGKLNQGTVDAIAASSFSSWTENTPRFSPAEFRDRAILKKESKAPTETTQLNLFSSIDLDNIESLHNRTKKSTINSPIRKIEPENTDLFAFLKQETIPNLDLSK